MANFNLTISPSQIEYVLKPGISITQAYDIINNSDTSITLNSQVLPWVPSGSDGSVNYQQAVPNPQLQFSLNNADIKLGQPFTIAPNSKQQLVLKIQTNQDIILSDNYYTFFVYQDQNTVYTRDSSSFATGKIGSHILLTVSDTENPKVESSIENFSITPKIKDIFFNPITISGQIKNNSDFFLKTNGKITVTKNGKTLKEFQLDDKNVLNHHSRDFSCENTTCTLNPPFWPGKYQVSVDLDPSLNPQNLSTSFYVLPLSPLAVIIFLAAIVLIIKKFTKKA